jgi:hypothetical protein
MTCAICKNCGADFERDPHDTWRTLCVPCWRQRQPKPRSQNLHADIIRGLRKHIGMLIVQCAPLDDEETCRAADEAYAWLNRVADIFEGEDA